MFIVISRIILRNRIPLLAAMLILTGFFGFWANRIQLSYDFARVLPANDEDFLAYEEFKDIFGEDGTVMVVGIRDPEFFTLEKFNDWYRLGEDIRALDGIEAVVSVAAAYNVQRNDSLQQFELHPLVDAPLAHQSQVDSIRQVLDDLPFYKRFIYNDETKATLMAITFDKEDLNTEKRIDLVETIKSRVNAYGVAHETDMHISGLPYIRTAITSKIASELNMFLLLALAVCSVILLIFFRNASIVAFSLLVVVISVIWSIGIISLFGYKITILSGLIPPLIIVIGIPNSILLLNKYHTEFRKHGNKIKALQQMVQRIGFTTFLANVTTAIGFGVFYFTRSIILMEFGLVAAINVMSTYLISLILIPALFSFLPVPKTRHTEHLQAKRISRVLEWINVMVHKYNRLIFVVVTVLVLVAAIGISRINTVGYVVDDLPKDDPVYTDMKFFEASFNGVLPLEISIDTKEDGKALKHRTLQKISRLTRKLEKYDELSKPLSIVDGLKFSYQAYRGGQPKYFILPSSLDLGRMSGYMSDSQKKDNLFRSFLDSTRRTTRVSIQMADIGSVKMASLVADLRQQVDSIFPPADFNTTVTGNSLIFLKGNDYLFKNLLESVALAIFLISIIMFMLFMSFRMIALSILPSIIPLVITAGLMGFFSVPLKPSTILIFSIAFGIASDGTIYFLTKYRQEMKIPHMTISRAVTLTIRETGVSMIYTAVILFAGFFIFNASGFGGTASLGKLLSVTLLVAMCSNLILLPAFLVSLERKMTTKAFLEEPLLQFLDEEEDIELDNLQIGGPDKKEPESADDEHKTNS